METLTQLARNPTTIEISVLRLNFLPVNIALPWPSVEAEVLFDKLHVERQMIELVEHPKVA